MGFYDIDTSVRINGGLTINGDSNIPSNSLNVGGSITGNIITGNTINAGTFNEGGIALSSKYLGINATAINSTQFNSLNSNQFVRSDTTTNISANIYFTSGNGVTFQTDSTDSAKIYTEYDSTIASGSTQTNLVLYVSDDSNDAIVHRVKYYGSGNATDVLTLNYNKATFDAGVGLYVGSNLVWNAGNDGAGSGLDADKLDGLDSTNFMKGVSANGFFGLAKGDGTTSDWIRTTVNGIIPYSGGTGSSLGTSSWNFNSVYSATYYEGNTALSSKYLGITAKASDSDKLDGLDSTQFLRSDVGTTLTGGNDLHLKANSGSTDSGDLVFQQGDGTENSRVYGGPDTLYLRTGSGGTYGSFTVTTSGGITYNGNKVWHQGNDGAGSGLDADTLDGLDSLSFVKADGTVPMTGELVINKSSSHLQLQESGVNKWHVESVGGQLRFVETGIAQRLNLNTGNTGQMTWNGSTVWNAGNDGSSSGLDADLLDGQHASAFAPSGYGLGTNAIRLGSGNDLNAITGNGWYDVQNPTNGVSGMSWHNILQVQTADSNYVNQLAFPMVDNNNNHLYIRNKKSGTWGSWSKVWSDSNMGSGSGLDSDTIDGFHISQIVNDTGISVNAQDWNTLTGNGIYRVGAYSGNNGPSGSAYASVYTYGTLEVIQTNNSVTQNYYSHSSGLNTGMWTRTKWNASDWSVWKKIWTDNNMGAGSGLDADKVDGLNATQFLRSDISTYLNGDLTVTGNVIATLNISGNHTGTGSSLTVNGTTVNGGVNPISNGWAYTHENKIGSLGHIPSGGSSTTFLRGDNTWVVPNDTYVTGLSSTAGGNGTLTVSRNTGGNLSINLSHNHDSSYLAQWGGTVTGNVNITAKLNADRFYQNANGSPTSNLGSPSITEMALFDSQFTNKTWFFDPTKFTFEYTTDGVTWTNLAPSTNSIKDFVSGLNSSSITIPNGCQQFRITIQNDGNYVYLNALYMYFSTNSHQTQVTIDKQNSQSQTWSNHVNSTTNVSSWPGHLYLPFNTIPFSNSTGSSSYYSSIRIIFTPTWSNDPTYGTQPINLYGMEVWGGYPSGKRTIYTWDRDKNITFPAQVTATGFIGSGNQLTVSGTPTSGSVNPINAGWAYSHTNSYGLGSHVPTGGTGTTYLRGDGTWVTPTDTYVTGISSTSGGNGILTVSMNIGSNLTLDLTHNHDSSYLGISGTAVNSTLLNNLSSSQFVRSDSATTMSTGLLFSAQATGGVASSTPTALSYGTLQAYGTLNILADTDGSHTEYLYLSAGYPTGAQNNGLAIGYNLANFTWKGYPIWHSGNMGSNSGLDADKLDGHDSTYFVYNGQNHLFNTMNGGASYDQVDFNTLTTIGEYRFINLGGSGTANKPTGLGGGKGYYFGMGGGDVSSRGFQLLGTDGYQLYFREMSNATWVKVWNDHNQGSNSGMDSDTVDGIHASQFVRNDSANQTVNNGFTMSGNAYVGMSNSSGALYIRTGSGSYGIQLAGDNSAQQSGVGSYINANGTANFSGTMTANTIAVTSTALVNNLNAQMINSVKEPQIAKNLSVYELGGMGVYTGAQVQAQGVPNMTVQMTAGTVYTNTGMRVAVNSGGSIAFSAPSATYNRIDSVYVQGSSAGANEGVITVMQGTAQSTPVAPTIPSDGVLLANVTIRQNAGSILSTDITDMRVWKPIIGTGANTYVNNNLYVSTINSQSNFINMALPVKNTPSNNSITISAGSTSYTWTHNLNLSKYIVKLSWNNPEPHVTWSNKTANAITINLDDTYDTDTIVDIGIEAF